MNWLSRMELNGLIFMDKFKEFSDESLFWDYALAFIESSQSVGISGGSTGKLLKHTNGGEFFLVDERNVPYESEYSNCRILREYSSENEIRCMKYDDDFIAMLPEALDAAVMGIGNDGHFASLFAGTDFESEETLVDTIAHGTNVKKRISLSMNYLLKTKKVLFLLSGKGKKEIWDKLKNNQLDGLPIGYFMDNFEGEIGFAYLG